MKALTRNIRKPDQGVYTKAKRHLDALAKPPGSLGKLEEIAARLCAIGGNLKPDISSRCIVVLAADNGVVEEGVASAPQAVTAIQTVNIAEGVTGVGVLAKQFHTDLIVADMGVNADLSHPALLDRKIRRSTGNIAKEPAMTREECEKAIETGMELAELAAARGYRAVGVGEMGIGNTTTSSAVLAALLKLPKGEIERVVGRGAGLDDAGFVKKISVIQGALSLHQPDATDPIDVLQKVGGLDLAAMAGVFIGSAAKGLPVVIDGFISVVAALCAVRLRPEVREYLFASHHSFERGYRLAMEALELAPCLQLEMRLGEGSGCPLLFAMMDGATAIFNNMATFGEAKINDDYLDNIREIGDTAF